MKTKAMIALALAHNPRLLILDEPTADLDPVARQELLDVLRDFVADGEKSVFFSTHITSDLDKVADYITIIHRGRILETMSMDQLEEKYVLLQGGIEQLKSLDKEFVGIKKGSVTFEGIITRDKANKFFPDIKGSKPNVESILTYSIWGDSNGRG
ncbi:MAG: ABC transporter ATP-binding protein [Clostridiales bacterium]|nr:ABC transporter ATP-binding protein [Clostridiales bacterium]